MKVLLQRVRCAEVRVNEAAVGRADFGILALVCAEPGDTGDDASFMARKTALMRIFEDENGKMNRSVIDVGGSVLAVSQFTLAAEWRKGNRPGFSRAAMPDVAEPLFEAYCQALRDEGLHVETGEFGAEMSVSFINQGPVTIWMDSHNPV